MNTHHRFIEVNGLEVFYREAGEPNRPTVVLLHGYPTSSFMFRNLIPELARDYHVIAPDHVGFGLSSAPTVEEFDYSFDALTEQTASFLDAIGVRRFAIYVQDYGAPIGWRLALMDPTSIWAIVSQNGNAYEAGFVDKFWADIWEYAENPNSQTEEALRPALGEAAIKWQYTHGVADPSVVSPDTWHHDAALVGRPGNDRAQLTLFKDYITNVHLYPKFHEYLRSSGVPVLAVWGKNDEIFGPDGAEAFVDDAQDAEIHLIDGGHFLLESALDQVLSLMQRFLAKHA